MSTKKQRLIDKLTGVPRYAMADALYHHCRYMRKNHKCNGPEGDDPVLPRFGSRLHKFVKENYWAYWTEFSDIERTTLGYLFLRQALLSGDLDP